MSQFIRSINYCIIDILIFNGEYFCYNCYQFQDDSPNPICNGKLNCFALYIPEDTSYCFVTRKPLGQRKYVILESNYQSVPRSSFVSLYKKVTDFCVSKYNVRTQVTTKPTTISALSLGFKQLDKSRSSQLFFVKAVFGLALFSNFYHAQIMTFDVSGTDETNDFGTGEPTVCQYVIKTYPFPYGSGYHHNHHMDLTLFILRHSCFYRRFFIPFLDKAGGKVHSDIFIPFSISMMVRSALFESFFLKNMLISDKIVLFLSIGIGLIVFFVLALKCTNNL